MKNPGGIVWHSRQAEVATSPAAEALVLFSDRLVSRRNASTLTAAGAIGEGVGRVELDEPLEDLGVTVIAPLS